MQDTLVDAVVKRLMADAPLGVLLSGGLDSSLVASIAAKCAPPRCPAPKFHMTSPSIQHSKGLTLCQNAATVQSDAFFANHLALAFHSLESLHAMFRGQTCGRFENVSCCCARVLCREIGHSIFVLDWSVVFRHGKNKGIEKLHTFSIGIEGSPDLKAAQKVADMIGTVHHGFTFTVQEGLDALFDVIWHIESYEQIRASVPMYLLSRKIKALGYKVRFDCALCRGRFAVVRLYVGARVHCFDRACNLCKFRRGCRCNPRRHLCVF
jgi:asparagine synthetase B (glutamine-hydrolysing)